MKHVASSAALLALVLSTPAVPKVPITFTKHPHVKQVMCLNSLGSAFRIGPDTFVTAAHVPDDVQCLIDEAPVTVSASHKQMDFATIKASVPAEGHLEYSCSGFRDGETYFALGYALGHPRQRLIVLRHSATATAIMGAFVEGMDALAGPATVIPGMSGGPVLDSSGKVVGVINAYNPFLGLSFSRSLSETPLCS